MSNWMSINFQDAASPNMENLIYLHDYIMMFMIMIIILILMNIIYLLMNKFNNLMFMNNQILEFIWTLLPMIILLNLSIPSILNLYLNEEMNNPFISIKIIGHQWYWSFEYSDFKNLSFDSFMNKNFKKFNFNFLDTDSNLIIPFNLNIRMIISSMDVIHSFSVPSLGIKMDAIPGRLNQINLNCLRPGMFFGQCSEICGINHSFMPICLESTNLNNFLLKMIKY